jgi:transposase-like protein
VIITDKLRSYGVAQRHLLPDVEHRQSRYLNNRAENSIGRRDDVNGRCSGSSRLSKPRSSSPLMRSSMATFIRGVT